MAIELHVEAGPHAGEVFSFDEHGTLVIGRMPEVQIRMTRDLHLSRTHCLIEVNPPLCRITDLRSTNKTRVNGAEVTTADLRDGDEIRVGKTVLRVRARGEVVPATLVDTPFVDTPTSGSAGQETLTYPPPEFPTIPGYRLEAKLGEGGMGTVYRGFRLADNLPVALKTIRPAVKPRPGDLERFLREAAILQQLEHPHIVRYLDSGEVNGLLYFVMELVPGLDAGQLVERNGPLEVRRAVRLACQVLEALAHAHSKGYVHRDIKPANILVQDVGPNEVARLADFGLARAYHSSALSGLTLSHSVGGTPQFMAPEQVTDFRKVKPPADQYGVAATLYYLLSGRHLFSGTTINELFQQLLTTDPPPLEKHRPGLPAGLWPALRTALARDPARRYPDVTAFAQALQRAVA